MVIAVCVPGMKMNLASRQSVGPSSFRIVASVSKQAAESHTARAGQNQPSLCAVPAALSLTHR